MRLATVTLGLGFALAFSAAPRLYSAADSQTETVDRSVAFPANGTIKINTFSGYVHITGGARSDISIHAARKAERDVLDHVKLDISTSGSVVTIDADKRDESWTHHDDNVVDTEFEIQAPAGATLEVNSFSSPVVVHGLTGTEHMKTFSGEITVTDARAPITAETFSAPIDIDAANAGAKPDISAKTFSGAIRARVSPESASGVEFTSFSGTLDTDIPVTIHSTGHRTTTRTPAGSTGTDARIHLETFSGSVHLTK